MVSLFLILLAALVGGLVAKLLRLPSLVGFILAGVVGGMIFAFDTKAINDIAELGVILLLFSVGLELSLEKLMKVGKIAILGGIIQILAVTGICYLFTQSIVLSLAFSLSSTALIVKIMAERGDTGTIHYEILTGWALVQDLAVIPIVAILPTLTFAASGGSWMNLALGSVGTTALILGITFLVGRLLAPYLTHLIAATNNRELLILLGVTLALGTASMVTLFGISPAFGAFLAGVVISKTQENHAIFSETRSLRDIFSVLFFVSLGFLITPGFILSHFFLIIPLAIFVIAVKAIVTFVICLLFGVKGRTAITVAIGLAQVGEFAFVLFLIAGSMKMITPEVASIGTATTLVTLLISPFLFKAITPTWRYMKTLTEGSSLKKFFAGGVNSVKDEVELNGHIIICGYGRMGKWVGRALKEMGVEFAVIDYNQKVVREASAAGAKAVYGDASYPEVLEAVFIDKAKAIIITLPDPIALEEIVIFCKHKVPNIKIMASAHLDADMRKLMDMKIHKIIQPEFEGALAVVKTVLTNSGRSKEEVAKNMKALRLSHANI